MEVGRNYEAVRLVGDAKLTLAALADGAGQARPLGPAPPGRGIEAEIAAAAAGGAQHRRHTTRDAPLTGRNG